MAKQSTPETQNGRRGPGAAAPPPEDAKTASKQATSDLPPEGPHAREDLTDADKTPGTGALTERRSDREVDAATG
jgi:hypothetical protein